jgi:hypothetical protein
MTATVISPRGSNGIYGVEANDLRWIDAARPGLRLAPVMEDRERGKFLGLLELAALRTTRVRRPSETWESTWRARPMTRSPTGAR